MTAALDRAVANAMGLKSVHNCEKWVGLTDEEKLDLLSDAKGMGGRICGDGQLFSLLEKYEAKLKEKNTWPS